MTTNRLAQSQVPVKLTPSQWADRGNEHLASIDRNDCRWVVLNGICVIEMKR